MGRAQLLAQQSCACPRLLSLPLTSRPHLSVTILPPLLLLPR
jgi:hypothetical protein